MESPRLYLIAGFLALLVLGGVAFAASQAESDGDVGVQQAYFVAAEPAGDRLNLTAQLFITNEGERDSDPVSLTVFVVPTHSGLASYTTKVSVGALPGRTTQEVTVPVVIPGFNASQSYRIDFLVFEDGLLTQKGSGSIGWGGGHYAAEAMRDDGAGKSYAADAVRVEAPSFQRVR